MYICFVPALITAASAAAEAVRGDHERRSRIRSCSAAAVNAPSLFVVKLYSRYPALSIIADRPLL
jgi:hypothetical protein